MNAKKTTRSPAMRGPRLHMITGVAVLLSALGWAGVVGAEQVQVVGTNPQQRLADAPEVREMAKPHGWYTWALTGITEPYPLSLQFLERQGNWYTPFIRPGMTGPYDIREWHGR